MIDNTDVSRIDRKAYPIVAAFYDAFKWTQQASDLSRRARNLDMRSARCAPGVRPAARNVPATSGFGYFGHESGDSVCDLGPMSL
jgi:hypothetical protein